MSPASKQYGSQDQSRGATALTYGLVVGLVGVAALAAVTRVGDSVGSLFTQVSSSIDPTSGPGSGADTDAGEALYSFSSHTFNSCGQTGRVGPSEADCESEYSGAPWATDDSLFSVTNGIQQWTVPETATYTIVIAAPSLHASTNEGAGSVITATVALTEGESVNIVVGQRGVGPWPVQSGAQPNSNDGLGGPGGSFVYTGTIGGSGLIGAAGGGNLNCQPTNLASCPGHSNAGEHGTRLHTSSVDSGPGAGWRSTVGKEPNYRVQGGQHFLGGNESDCSYTSCAQQPGGFGGGGGSGNDNIGGSGGYTGGSNAQNNAYTNEGYPGGSSPQSATRSQSVVFTTTNTGPGYVTITKN